MENLPIVDSKITLLKAIAGTQAPKEIVESLALIDINYISTDGMLHTGQLVVHKDVAQELKEIFAQLLVWQFPIEKAVPVVIYNWSDDKSMADNNTSAFNYRNIYGTEELSNHSYGLALDINPKYNPYVAIDGTIFPEGAEYKPEISGTLLNDKVVNLFESKGWQWGGKGIAVGNTVVKDWQHFQKIKQS
jgi:peptidoglycan L-alanyl-D-glutamate endopeptidase CwlK